MSWLSFLIHIPLLLVLAFYFARKWRDQPLREFYFPALILKFIAGVAIGLIYIWVYKGEGDTIVLFHYSAILNDLLFNDPATYFKYLFFNEPGFGQDLMYPLRNAPRALIFVKILALVNIFTLNNYWVTGLYLSFFSFLGFYALSNAIVRIFKISILSALISFLFFPSVVFWSSGVMKESILIGAIGFLVSFVLSWLYENQKPDWKMVLVMIFSIAAIFYIKFYYFIILIPGIASLAITFSIVRLHIFKERRFSHPFIFLLVFGLIALSGTFLVPQLNLNVFLKVLSDNYDLTIFNSKGINVFYFSGFSDTWVSLFAQFPKALFAGLFRPLPGDIKSFMGYISMMENTLVIFFFVITVIYLIIKRPVFLDPLPLTAVIVYITILAFILPIASPNWGSLVRYRVGYLPFFLLLITFRNPIIFYLESKFLKRRENDKPALKKDSSSQ
jgi:hypothetical protein